jgi:hypothetical protein
MQKTVFFGVQLVLNNDAAANIDFTLRILEDSDCREIYHLIYMFWKRVIKNNASN